MKHVRWGGRMYSQIFNSDPGFEKKKGEFRKDMKHVNGFNNGFNE